MSFGGGGGKAWPFLTPTGSQPLLLPVGVTQDRSLLQACTLLRKGGGRGAVDGPSLMARSRDSCNCMAYLYWCGSAHAVPGHNITHWVPAGNQRAGVGAGLIGAEHEPPPELSHSKRRRLLLGAPALCGAGLFGGEQQSGTPCLHCEWLSLAALAGCCHAHAQYLAHSSVTVVDYSSTVSTHAAVVRYCCDCHMVSPDAP